MKSTAIMLPRNVSNATTAIPRTAMRAGSRDVDRCRNGDAFPKSEGAALDSAGFASVARISLGMMSEVSSYLFLLVLVCGFNRENEDQD